MKKRKSPKRMVMSETWCVDFIFSLDGPSYVLDVKASAIGAFTESNIVKCYVPC